MLEILITGAGLVQDLVRDSVRALRGSSPVAIAPVDSL